MDCNYEVVLVNDQAPLADKNPNARYIAQRTQLGTGNMLNGQRTLIPKSSQVPVDRLGTCDDCGFSPFGDDTSTSRDTAF